MPIAAASTALGQRAIGTGAQWSGLFAVALHLGEHRVVKAAAARAGLSAEVSAHWLRHAHVSHALDRGAPVHLVAATLGHSNIATTGRYLHARPNDRSPVSGELTRRVAFSAMTKMEFGVERISRGNIVGIITWRMPLADTLR